MKDMRIVVDPFWRKSVVIRTPGRLFLVPCICLVVSATVVGAAPKEQWVPPENANEIVSYMIQDKLESRLKTGIEKTKKDFESEVTKLGKQLYDSGITEARLQELVAKVLEENGKKNPTVNYQKDLASVVEKAVDELLVDSDFGAMQDYVKKDILDKLLKAIATKGMQNIAHMVTAADLAEVYEKAYKKASEKFKEQLERAKRNKTKIEDANLLWKRTLEEEYVAAARTWILEELQKNWGIELRRRSPEYTQVEQVAEGRINQLPVAGTDLPDFIKARVQAICEDAERRGLSERDRKKLVSEFFETLRYAANEPISRKEEKEIISQIQDQGEEQARVEEMRAQIDAEQARKEAEQAQLAKEERELEKKKQTWINRRKLETVKEEQAQVAQELKELEEREQQNQRNQQKLKQQDTVKTYHCQFLIELTMPQRNSSKVDMHIHLCKVDAKGNAGIEKRNVMKTRQINVGLFSPDNIDAAAKAIQDILEDRDSFNHCVDEAMARGMEASGALTAPPVQLSCYLRKDGKYLGGAWNDAVRVGVTNTAKNDWTNADIRFMRTLGELDGQ